MVELEGKESFVDKHLEKFEEIFKIAVKEAINRGVEQTLELKAPLPAQASLPVELTQQKEDSAVIDSLLCNVTSQAVVRWLGILLDQQ